MTRAAGVALAVGVLVVAAAIVLLRTGEDAADVARREDGSRAPHSDVAPVASLPAEAPAATSTVEPAASAPAEIPPDSITGVVRDPFGAPIAGVEVTVRRESAPDAPPASESVTTDADGRFAVAPASAGARHAITFRERAHVARVVHDVAAGAALSVVLRDGFTVRGRVVDEATVAPIAGAHLDFSGAGGIVSSDADGRFETGVDPNEASGTASKPGYLPWRSAPLRAGANTELAVRLKRWRGNSTVYLAVTDAVSGGPLDGVSVREGPVTALGGGVVGVEIVEHSEQGSMLSAPQLVIGAPDHADTPIELDETDGRSPDAPRMVALERSVTIQGRVVDAEGRAVGGAVVKATPDWNRVRWFVNTRLVATTNEDGSFSIDGVPGRLPVRLEATDARFAVPALRPVKTPPEGTLPIEALAFPAVRVARGTVSDAATGLAIAGATLLADWKPRGFGSGASGRDGSFALALPQAETRLRVGAPGFVPRTFDAVDVSVPLDVRMERGLSISGRVVDPTGGPVPGARVALCAWKPLDSRPADKALDPRTVANPFAFADDHGRFWIEGVPPGRVGLNVTNGADDDNFVIGTALPYLLEHDLADVTLTWTPKRLVAGRVFDADSGAPIPAFEFALTPGSTHPLRWVVDGEGRFIAPTYELKVDLEVSATGYSPRTWTGLTPTLGAILEVECALKRASAIDGRVVDASGAPLEKITIAFESASGASPMIAVTDSSGRFHLAPLAPGESRVIAQSSSDLGDGSRARRPIAIEPDVVEIIAGQATSTTFVARDAGDSSIDLDFALPAQAKDVVVQLVLSRAGSSSKTVAVDSIVVTLSSSKRAHLGPFAPGEYRVTGSIGARNARLAPFQIDPAAATVVLAPSAATPLRIEIPASVVPKKR